MEGTHRDPECGQGLQRCNRDRTAEMDRTLETGDPACQGGRNLSDGAVADRDHEQVGRW